MAVGKNIHWINVETMFEKKDEFGIWDTLVLGYYKGYIKGMSHG